MVEVFTPQSCIALAAYTFLSLHTSSYDQLLPIFMHHPQQSHNITNTSLPFKFSGGFGLASGRIGSFFTAYGILGCVIQFLVFPPFARKIGVLRCFKLCGIIFPIVALLTPYTALITDSNSQQTMMFGIMLIRAFAVIFSFPCSIILLTNSAVDMRILGTLNGFAVSISAVGRAIGPAVSGWAFSWGVKHDYIVAPYILIAILAGLGAVPIWYIVESEEPTKKAAGDDEELEGGEEGEREGEGCALLGGTREEERVIMGSNVQVREDEATPQVFVVDGKGMRFLQKVMWWIGRYRG